MESSELEIQKLNFFMVWLINKVVLIIIVSSGSLS